VRDPVDRSHAAPGPRPPVRPFGFAGGLVGRESHVTGMSVALLVGCGLLIAGLEVVRVSPLWGFTYSGAMSGVLPQLSVTGPAAVLIAAATARERPRRCRGLFDARGASLPRPVRAGPVPVSRRPWCWTRACSSSWEAPASSAGRSCWPFTRTVAVAYVATRRRRPLMAGPMRMQHLPTSGLVAAHRGRLGRAAHRPAGLAGGSVHGCPTQPRRPGRAHSRLRQLYHADNLPVTDLRSVAPDARLRGVAWAADDAHEPGRRPGGGRLRPAAHDPAGAGRSPPGSGSVRR